VLTILQLIVDTVAGVLGGVLLLRFWMQVIRVRPPASVAQFTFTLTDWLVRPLRRILPGVGGYDWASLIGAFLVVLLASSLFCWRGWSGSSVLLYAAGALPELDHLRLHGPLDHRGDLQLGQSARAAGALRARAERSAAAAAAPVIPPVGGTGFVGAGALILLQIVLYVQYLPAPGENHWLPIDSALCCTRRLDQKR
jgi:YggT family protein